MPPQMPSRATSSPPKIPWVRRIRIYPTTVITSLSGQPRQVALSKAHGHGYPAGEKYSTQRKTGLTERTSSASGLLLCGDLAADLVHVEVADGLDQLLE